MKRAIGVLLALGAAALFIRLGIWQMGRLRERQANNAAITSRMTLSPIVLARDTAALDHPDDSLLYRRVVAAGTFDYGHEFVDEFESFEGSPGVNLVTPLRLADGRAVLVVRGWVFSPDARGRHLDHADFAEPDTALIQGILVQARGKWAIRPDSAARVLPYPVLPFLLLRTSPPGRTRKPLVPVPVPALDNGPHLSYAIQWFAFAAIALAGGGLFYFRKIDSA